jgi:uncharacterized protein related to proFAR isomerase
MEIIPLINIKNRKIVKFNNQDFININDYLNEYQNKPIYFLDHDGINKNKPNLCLIQKLSKKYELWVDQGPNVLGDIVDSIIAGAENITIRSNLIDLIDLKNIKDIIEKKIFLNIDFINKYKLYNFDNNKIFDEFKLVEQMKNFVNNNNSYAYIHNKNDIKFLNKYNFKGYLVDIEYFEEFKIGI